MAISLKFAVIACIGLSSTQLSAQDTVPSAPRNNRWGLRSDFVFAHTHPGRNIAFGGTYLLHNRHQFSATALLNPFAFNSSLQYKSPFLGTSLSYQYFFSERPKCFRPYAYSSVSFQRFSLSTENYATNRFDFGSAMIGLGFEARFGSHFYGNCAAGIGIGFYNTRLTYTNSSFPSQTFKSTSLISEFKFGVGYRF